MDDRDNVVESLNWVINDIEENGHYQVGYYADEIRKAIALLKEQKGIIESLESDLAETLDVVSNQKNVVRCKDCRWGEPTKNAYGEDRIICGNDDTYTDRYITLPADWFCAEGARKGL